MNLGAPPAVDFCFCLFLTTGFLTEDLRLAIAVSFDGSKAIESKLRTFPPPKVEIPYGNGDFVALDLANAA